jgi:hypothetical protein
VFVLVKTNCTFERGATIVRSRVFPLAGLSSVDKHWNVYHQSISKITGIVKRMCVGLLEFYKLSQDP